MWQILIVCDLVPHLCSRVVISNVSITAHSLWPLHVAFNTFEFFVFFLQCSLLLREVKRVTDQAIASIIKSCHPPTPPPQNLYNNHPPPSPDPFMESVDISVVSVPSHNGCSWSKWTEGLSCVLNSLLLSLGAHGDLTSNSLIIFI